jgi:PAS domain S-box-containing protein
VDSLLESIRSRGHVDALLRRSRVGLETRMRRRTQQLERANQALRAEMVERTRALAAFQASEQRYRHLFEEADDIICTFDLLGKFTSLNRAGERISGYQREELIGRSMAVLTEPDGTERGFQMIQAKLGGQGCTTYDLPIRTREGRKVLLEVRSRLLFDGGKPVGILAIGRDVTERKRTEEVLRESEAALQRSREQLRALAAGLLTAQEEERRRLSRELHDDFNQKLAMFAVQAESLEQELPPTHHGIRPRIAKLREGVNSLSDDVRHIAYQLHPSILDHLGLVVALRSLCQQFSRRHGVKTRFIRRRLPPAIPQDVALCLYRVAQEALGNVAKHARSARATVALSGGPEGLHLSITDYGVGFDPAAVENRRGLGLISMEERVRLAEGTFCVRTRPRGGTRLDVRIPLTGEDA